MSKFAVNAVQQIDSAIMSGLQRMPWIDVLTNEGNAFQTHAAATGKARSPRVARRVDNTSSVDVDPDLRRRRDSTSEVILPGNRSGLNYSCCGSHYDKTTVADEAKMVLLCDIIALYTYFFLPAGGRFPFRAMKLSFFTTPADRYQLSCIQAQKHT